MAKWWNGRHATLRPSSQSMALGVRISPWLLYRGVDWSGYQLGLISRTTSVRIRLPRLLLRMGQCPIGSHKPGDQVQLLDPQLFWRCRPTGRVVRLKHGNGVGSNPTIATLRHRRPIGRSRQTEDLKSVGSNPTGVTAVLLLLWLVSGPFALNSFPH